MSNWKNILAAALMMLASAGAGAAEPEYLRWVGAADEAVAKGDWAKAQECYRAAMRKEPANPNNLLLMCNLGMVQHYAGEDSLALETLTQAHAMEPKSVAVLSNRAKVLEELGRRDDAIADFTRVLDIDSLNTTALFNRGYLRLRKGDAEGAERDLLTLQRVDPENLNTISSLAVLYSNTGRFKEAIPQYDKLVEKRPTGDVYATRAFCKLSEGDLTGGSEDIAEGLKISPDNGELYYCRAYLNQLRYLTEDARADAKRAQESGVLKERTDALFEIE